MQLQVPTPGWDAGRLRLLVQNCTSGLCNSNMTSRGSRSGLAEGAKLSAKLNGHPLVESRNTSRLFPSIVPSSWTEAFLGFDVPVAALNVSGGANVLAVTLESGALMPGHASHLVHMDLQLPARTTAIKMDDEEVSPLQPFLRGETEYAGLSATALLLVHESGPFPPNTQASRFMRNPVLAYTPYAYNGGNWSAELFEPLLGYQSENRSTMDEMFDSVWLVGYTINGKSMFPKRDPWMNNSHSLFQADWVDFLAAQIAAARSLEAAAKSISAALGRTVSPTVMITLPYPDPRQDQFGHGSTDRMLNFSRTADRISGVEWYVDLATQQWNATVAAEGWTHLQFVGFYWVEESVCGCVNHAQTGCMMCDTDGHPEFDKFDMDDAAVLPNVTAYVHEAPGNLLINWIPYYDVYNANWAPKWRELGFDLAVLQPHVAYAGADPSKVFGTNDTTKQFGIIADMVSSAGLGVEMEVASYTRNNLPEPDEDSWIYNFELYCQAAHNHSWETDALKVWFHAGSFLEYWRDCAPRPGRDCNATDVARKRQLYDEIYWMIKGSWPQPPSLKTDDGSELPARASLSSTAEPSCIFSVSTFSFSLLKNGTLASFVIGHVSSELPQEYASGGAFIEAATTAGPSAVWQPVSSVTCAADSTNPHTTLLQAQIAHPRGGTLSASVMVEIVGQFVRLSINALDAEIQQLRFGGLSLAMSRGGNGRCQNGFPMAPCDYLPHATDNRSAIVLMPLSPTVETAVDRTDPHVQRLHASAMRALPLHPPYELIRENPRNSTAVLLWAGAQTDMHDALRMAETAFDIPSPRIGAVRAKDSPAMQQGYFLESWKSVSNLVAAAKASGLSYVMIVGWETTEGHFAVNQKIFPGGDEGLKAAVGLLHAAGLKVGIHFLSNLISKTDAYVTPIPHPDLAVDATLDMASSISAKSTFIPTLGTPTSSPWLKTDWPAPSSSGLTPGSVDYQFTTSLVRIENELITYKSANSSGLVGCTRGALGSKAVAHESAAKVQHLAQMYNFLMPRPGSQLLSEISDRLAHVYNYCELDMVYFDGAEGLAAMGSEQVPIALFEAEFFKKLTRGILVEGSSIAPYTWWLNARANTGDYAFIDPKSYMDVIKRAQCAVHTRNGMNPELGWWGMAAGGVGWLPTYPDEIEYMARWAVALDVSPQIEVGGTNSRASECLSRMLPWALLGAQNPPEELRARLRQTQLDFEMRKLKESKYSITPVKYHGNTGGPTAAIVDSVRPETKHFSLPRYFGASSQSKRIGLRLRCLPVLQSPGTSATVLLDGTAADKRQMTVSSSSGLLMKAAWAPGPPRTGVSEETLALTAHVNATEAYVPTSEWARATFEYTTEVDLSTPSAAEHAERAIVAWVWSDGCGGVLNVQLGAGAGYGLTQREYYTHLTWTGWKLLLLEQQETALTLFDFEWPYNQESSQ